MAGSSQSGALERLAQRARRAAAATLGLDAATRMVEQNIRRLERARAYGTISGQAAGASSKVGLLNAGQEMAEKSAKRLGSVWKNIHDNMSADRLLKAGKAAAAYLDTLAAAKAKLGQMNDGMQTTAQLQDMVLASANRSRSSYQGVADTVSSLRATGAFDSSREAVGFTELLNKQFAVSGTSEADAAGFTGQLAQAMADGKLTGTGVSELNKSAPVLAQAIADLTGNSVEDLRALGDAGGISAEVIKSALYGAGADIEARFAQLPATLGGTWTQIKNQAAGSFSGVLEGLGSLLSSPFAAGVLSGISAALNVLAQLAQGVLWLLSGIAGIVSDNWGIIQAALTGILGALALMAAVQLPILLQKLQSMVLPILQQAAAWAIAHLPLLMMIAAVALLAYAMQQAGVTFADVCGTIGGLLGGLYAFLYNLVADAWNLIAVFVEFFANVFQDPIGSVGRLFLGLADVALGVLESIANALDAVFGSNMAATVAGWRGGLQQKADEAFGPAAVTVDRMEKLDAAGTAETWSSKGVDLANGIGSLLGGFSLGSSALDLLPGAGTDGIPEVDRVDSVGGVERDVNVADEDLKFLRDVAEARFVQNFVTLTPTVAMNASISERVDVDSVVGAIERRLESEFAMAAEGVYA